MMEEVKKALNTQTLTPVGKAAAGGCISDGQSYKTDSGIIFLKHNNKPEAKAMFDGEYASLEAIYNTSTVRVPKPLKVFPDSSGDSWFFAMEHLELTGHARHQGVLGEHLHLQNLSLKKSKSHANDGSSQLCYVSKFGFHCPTSCGLISMPNDWEQNWTDFYISKRLEPQMSLIEKTYGDDEAKLLLQKLKPRIPAMFEGIEVEPSLLHGDLWSGNYDETQDGPVIFDPASFYGHHEFDLAITAMFGGFSQSYYDGYHKLIPKAPGFSTRHKLYQLFHYLNHWNHFGTSYIPRSIALLEELSTMS